MSSDVIRSSLGRLRLHSGKIASFILWLMLPAMSHAAAVVAKNDSATTAEESAITIDVLLNDMGSNLVVTVVTIPAAGSAVLNPDQTVTYTPSVDFVGGDSFTYGIDDGAGGTDAAIVNVTVTQVNDPPIANGDIVNVAEDSSVAYAVLANDTDVDGDSLSVTLVSMPGNGAVVINADGSVSYTPSADFNGADSFSYTMIDGNGGSDQATVTVTVDPVNDAPVAGNDSVVTDEDTPFTVAVLANDVDIDGDALAVLLVNAPANGSVMVNANQTLTYTPNANFNGSDPFSYIMQDIEGATSSASVSVSVTAVNDPPAPVDDTAGVVEDGSVTIFVLANDTDVEGDLLSVLAAAAPANGSVTLNADSSVTYTPNADFNGSDSFEYTADDGNAGFSNARVSVTVSPIADAPVALDDSLSVDEDSTTVFAILANDFDVDGDALFLSTTTFPTNGNVTINADDTVTYTPLPNFNGIDSFAYVVEDGTGFTDIAGVSITVNPVNDAPVAGDDGAMTDEDTPVTLAVLPNDFDVEGDALSVVGASNPANGSTVVNADNTVRYVPDQDFNGTDSYTYTVADGNGGFDTGLVSVTIIAVNDAPVAVNDGPTTNEDSTVVIAVLANDVDVDGDSLSMVLASAPTNGVVVANMDGTVSYTPATDFNGVDSFTYIVSDPSAAADTGTVNVTVAPVNDAPFVANAIVDVNGTEDVNASASVLGVFDDVDIVTNADALTLSIAGTSNPSLFDGVSVLGSTVVMDVAPDQNGSSTVTVRATDSAGAFVEQSFAVVIDPVNDAPFLANQILDLSAGEDAPNYALNLDAVFADVDGVTNGDTLALSVASNSNMSLFDSVSVVGTTLNLDFAPDQNGAADLTIQATDQAGATIQDTFTVVIDAINDAPFVAAPLPDVAMNEDAPNLVIDVASYLDDVDIGTNTDALSFSVGFAGNAVFDAVTVVGSALTLDLAQDMNGAATVTVRATDLAGLFVEDTFAVVVNPVNDAPFVAVPIADVIMIEDGADELIGLLGVFDDVDLSIEGDGYLYTAVSSDPMLFEALVFDFPGTGPRLTLDLAENQNGSAVVSVYYTDQGGLVASDDFLVTVIGTNDSPLAEDDFLTLDEDATNIVIDVLANDFREDAPVTVARAGMTVVIDGMIYPNATESVPTTMINALGDPVTQPNGTVVVEADMSITYIPKLNFNGLDFFTYTIRDADGEESIGRVTITVNAVNDAPSGFSLIEYTIVGDTFLSIMAPGLLLDARDVDGDAVFLVLQTTPLDGSLLINPDGSFVYTPDVGFVGTDQFTYFLSDSKVTNAGGPYVVSIDVTPPPPAPIPPPPGEVEFDFQLADLPLELAEGTDPNVVVLWDDSGSMDWSLAGPKEMEGRFLMTTVLEAGVKDQASTFFSYVHDVSTNRYQSSSELGRVVPSEEAIAADPKFNGNSYGVWRTRNHKYNRVYYNPEVHYVPWPGLDPQNQEFANADPIAARLNPIDWKKTIDLTQPVNYSSGSVPCMRGCRIKMVSSFDFYLPRYYITTVDGPDVAWNDPHTLVEIRDDGSTYQGGPERADCAVDDGVALTCTYAQEVQNFANWFSYYRSREYVAKFALGDVVADATGLRVGYAPLNDANDRIPIKDMNATFKAGNKRVLMDQIYRVDANGSSPIRSQLDRVGKYYECASANVFHQAGSSPGDPNCPIPAAPLGECQVNYALVFTDGRWNQGLQTQNYDNDADTSFDGGRYAGVVQGTLADVAIHYYERDLHPTLSNQVPTSIRDRAGAPIGAFGADEKTMHQHMKTFGIQFGLTGRLSDIDIPGDITQPVNWGDPFSDPDAKTDDVRHAALNGRGAFLTVFNPQELADAMNAAFDEFAAAEGTASAVAFNSQQVQQGNLIFRGFYDSGKNTGDLVAQQLDADGFPIEPPLWSAAEGLDGTAATDRVIVTFDSDPSSFNNRQGIAFRYAQLSGEQQGTLVPSQVDYLRGDRSNERPFGFNYRDRPDIKGVLGDIVNSTPVFIGVPSFPNRDREAFPTDAGNLYSEFKDAHTTRQPMVAVGANDGMLHIFDTDSGEEIVAYLPDKLINGEPYANPLYQLTSLGYNHKYFVDLTPAVNDVFAKGRTDFVRRWRTVLVGGLRGGGKGYFALDVTNPSAFTTEAGAAGEVLWEFTDADDASPSPATLDLQGLPVKDLGYAYSQPTLVMTNAEIGAIPRKRWAAVFGNGYNSTAGVAKLFALFIEDGVDGWDYAAGDFVKIDTGFGAPGVGEYNQGLPNGLGTPRMIDLDQNGTADIAFAGDMRGNLFRFDLRDTDPANWGVTKVFTATYPDGVDDIPQPITTQPIVIRNPQVDSGFIVVFATGSYITEPDGTSEEIQSIYGIWDRLEDNPAITRADLVEQEIINLVDPDFGNLRTLTQNVVDYAPPSTVRGWFVDLDAVRAATDVNGLANTDTAGNAPPEPQFPGERAIRNLQLRGGFLFVNTVIPRDANSCQASPGGFQMAMNPATGALGGLREEVAFDLNNDGSFDDWDRAGDDVVAGMRFEDGVPTDSAFIGNRRYTQLSSKDIDVVRTNTETASRTGRLSWKEMNR